jgi:hypothetical protein
MTRISDGRDAGAFITAALDDFGLDPHSFRLYARIVRRAGTKQGCFESIDNMAKACRMGRNTAYDCLKLLIKHRLIEKEPHTGKPSNYYLTPPSEWIPLADLSLIRDTEPIPNQGHHLSLIRDTTYPQSGTPPIPDQGHKGINKGNPIKEQHQGGKKSADADGKTDPFYTGQARQIAREVIKVSRQINAPKNFITDAPWGRLADEVGKDPLGVWQAFEQFILAKHSDKRDPANYCSVIANKLYENVGSELNCKEWLEFADYFRKNLSAPPAPKKSEPRQVEIVEIPDREASREAFRRLKG